MDQQHPINTQNIKQEQQVKKPELTSQFLLAGQTQSNIQLQRKNYDSSAYIPTPNGLVSLFSGFPFVSAKTDALSLSKFPVQYLPARNDFVIGVIKVKTSETFIVDIGAPMDAVLGGLEFDGVTKRNKPNLKIGTLVFCRVVQYSKHIGGKLSCINKGYATKKNNEMGELKQGYMFWVPPYQHQTIQKNLLEKLGKCVKFEVAFGKNGRIWINSAKLQNIMLLANMFKMCANNAQQFKINALIAILK